MTAQQTSPKRQWRVGLVVASRRAEELFRRALRLLKCGTLIFESVEELEHLSKRGVDQLIVELGGLDAEHSLAILSQLRQTHAARITVTVPTVHRLDGQLRQFDGVIRHRRQSFGRLLAEVMTLVPDMRGMDEPSLTFGDYTFFPLRSAVAFGEQCIVLDSVEFDAALELFVHQGKTLNIDHLQRMLPHADLDVDERLIWQWLATLPTKLSMGAFGWQLKIMGPTSVCLLAPAAGLPLAGEQSDARQRALPGKGSTAGARALAMH